MTELLNRLSANPADWDLRTSIVRQYYEARDFDMAAKILAQAALRICVHRKHESCYV